MDIFRKIPVGPLLLALLLALAGCTARSGRAVQRGAGVLPEDFVLELERTACYGRCPIYKLTVDARGRLRYAGTRFVATVGTLERDLSPQQQRQLWDLLQRLRLEQYEDRYDQEQISDLPSTLLSLTQNDRKKSIYARYEVPEALTQGVSQLEQLLIPGEVPGAP